MRRTPLAVGFWAYLIAGSAQAADALIDNVDLRETLDSKKTPQPAFASVTKPRGAPLEGQVGAGVRYDVAGLLDAQTWLTLGPFVEYHRNTSIKKPQDVFEAGISFEVQPLDLGRYPFTPVVAGKVTYKRDGEASTSGYSGSLLAFPLVRGAGKDLGGLWKPDRLTDFFVAEVSYIPWVGVEHEAAVAAPAGAPTGSVSRVVLRVQATLFPVPSLTDYRLEALVEYTYRQDLLDALAPVDQKHTLFKAGLNLYLLKMDDVSAGVGIDYVSGEDPSKGLVSERYWTFAAKLRL